MSAQPWLLIAAFALAACTGNSLGLSGAGSMRVEVEVYKGPLGQSVPIQVGELQSVLEETARAMRAWTVAARAYHRSRCVKDDRTSAHFDCDALNEVVETGYEVVDDICSLSPQLAIYDYENFNPPRTGIFQSTCEGMTRNQGSAPKALTGQQTGGATELGALPSLAEIQAKRAELARRISAIAGNMKSKSFRIADGLISYVPADRKVRAFIANFSLIAAEYANQIQARLGVLDKQLAQQDRKTLPVGQYLRDASPTDFINLFEWFGATYDDRALIATGQLGVPERVRMAERLFADYYWEKINEVYTNGQGDVSMAFIKNDIGNWDLKSFSNHPAELVGAYRDAADAAISAIADVASGGSTQGVRAGQRLLDLGNRIATGESGLAPNLGVLDASALHSRTLAKLAAQRKTYVDQEATLIGAKTAADQAVADVPTAADTVAARQADFDNAARQADDCAAQNPTDAEVKCAEVVRIREKARSDLAEAQAAKAAADAELDRRKLAAAKAAADLTALGKAAQMDIREILDDHLALIAMLQEAVAGSIQSETPGAAVTPGVSELSLPSPPVPVSP